MDWQASASSGAADKAADVPSDIVNPWPGIPTLLLLGAAWSASVLLVNG